MTHDLLTCSDDAEGRKRFLRLHTGGRQTCAVLVRGNKAFLWSRGLTCTYCSMSPNIVLSTWQLRSDHPSFSELFRDLGFFFTHFFGGENVTIVTCETLARTFYGRRVNSFVLVCSLSSHRHFFIPLIFGSRFIDS